jgi:tetratricopeptide (TPR) repeat protein
LRHLGDDAERILNLAEEYLRLGMYAQALAVLSRPYPEAVSEESEPGVLPADQHPMVAYYRAYCREKLHQSTAADLSTAEKLPTTYIFPSRATDRDVLQAALRLHSMDATAHYLLGTFLFARGLNQPALAEWEQAGRINPRIPVLHASWGRALLHTKDDPELAFTVFQEGLGADPRNEALYTGIDQALSLLQRSPHDRVQALERYPDRANMPTGLVYELILNLSESGEFDKAVALFHGRFFPRAEGGTNVRQVWLEVQMQHAMQLAQGGGCAEAIQRLDHLAEPAADLTFTRDGLEPILGSARFSYLIGSVYRDCGRREKAQTSFARAAQQSGLENAVWAVKASERLPNFERKDAMQKLQSLRSRSRNNAASGDPSAWWLYNIAMLDAALGEDDRAEQQFRRALLAPDHLMAYHLTRLARSSQAQRPK